MNGHICRFEPDCPRLSLQKVGWAANISCDLLEDALDDPLDPSMDFPVTLCQQDDALLLQCRLPRPTKTLLQESAEDESTPMASITGLPEEFAGSQPKINISVYQGSLSETKTTSGQQCSCHAPLSDWKRQNLHNVPEADNNQQATDDIQMMWVDLRACAASDDHLVPSLTSAAHFLRSLLGTSHGASPWCPQESAAALLQRHKPYRVAVLFPGKAPDYLVDIRVGDICPSWLLYSISRVQVPPTWSPWAESTLSTETTSQLLQPATLMVYKQIPPRPVLSISPPPRIAQDETHLQGLPKGCLWEVYFEYPENSNHDSGDQDEKKQTSADAKKALKIPHCRMTAPPYLSHVEDYDQSKLQPLLDNWKTIRDEALQIPQWTAWPETQHYSKATNHGASDGNDMEHNNNDDSFHPSWTVFPLCHCFPADQPDNKKWIDQTCAFVPKTIQLLQHHLGPVLRTALFSRLDPETTLEAHTGWADLANHVYRCHLPLVVPQGQVCGTWVDGCVETHEEGRFLCFDDSKTHRAFNYSNAERIVLILDLARPEHLPLGTATGGHSDELDQFIASMNL